MKYHLVTLNLLLGLLSLSVWAAEGETKGVYALCASNKPIDSDVLANPSVDGIALQTDWDQVETAEGIFDWNYLDSQIAAAAQAGKKVSLSIDAGFHSPSWVYSAGAEDFQFTFDAQYWGKQLFCTEARIPIPWDPVFKAKWKDFIQALGKHYDDNPAVTHVKITGINKYTQETALPNSISRNISNGSTSCVTEDDVSRWLAAGYTRDNIKNTWVEFAEAFSQAFPHRQICLMGYPPAFPPIDNNGQVMAHQNADFQLAVDLMETGALRYPHRFIAQNNGLSATWSWPAIAKIAQEQRSTGYQMLWSVTGDSTCRMNQRKTPCDPHAALQAAVDRGIREGAQFLEIYPSDIKNAALRDVIDAAHARLTQ